MALIFLWLLVVFNVSSFEFHQVKLAISPSEITVTLSPMMNGPQFTRPQSTGLSGLGAMLESYCKLQLKPKTTPKFKKCIFVDLICLTRKSH